ncbi:MAG: DNA polymerase I [Acidobacteria bacterium]|nr:DNA polymerase I [Acidobacteriota bacterium]
MPEKIFLIDGSALAYRSFFAFIRNPLITSKGENTSATFGFATTLIKIIEEEKPDYLAVIFDSPKPTFRHRIFPEYKATRQKMPDEMRDQLPRIRELLDALRVPTIEIPGYEADDVIGTMAVKGAGKGATSYIVTGDKDFMQLVGERILIYNLRAGGKGLEILDERDVIKKFGVPPSRVIDILALMGDKSDNIPGVPGVGEKTALELIKRFGSLEGVYANLDKIEREKLRRVLAENKKQAFLSRELVTIKKDLPLELELTRLKRKEPDRNRVISLFLELEFSSLIDTVVTDATKDKHSYHTIKRKEELERLIEKVREAGALVVDTETTALSPMSAELIGISFAIKEREAYYLPLLELSDFTLDEALRMVKPILEDPKIRKIGQNIKYDLIVFKNYGIELSGIEFDTMVASYLLNPSRRQHNLDSIALEYLNYKKIPTKSLIGKGKKQISMSEVPLTEVAEYACEDADITLRLRNYLEPRLKTLSLWNLFTEIEMPLVRVLAIMEMNGVSLDVPKLAELSQKLAKELYELELKIYELSGEKFNINSPQQLSHILFEKLKIHKELGIRKGMKKTKTGYSTDSSVLNNLSAHPLVKLILNYRELSKLKSTYIDALPKMINPKTGRIHTSYNQTVTATGRLSSSEPNLQNIPIRSEIGKEIRKAFIPRDKGWLLLSADYSQIELRIVAHLSEDPLLIEAFRAGEDIHRKTASVIFGVPMNEVTKEMRSRAKAINFGIIYGMGPQRLAAETGLSLEEAKRFIETYFEKHPKVHFFIEKTIADARERGYVTTLLGRRRLIPEIRSSTPYIRASAENIAINTPIQGTAADLIKRAMVKIQEEIEKRELKTKMIIQIHDELLFEVPEGELDEAKKLIKEEMEGVMELLVPIVVDIGVGRNWLEAH